MASGNLSPLKRGFSLIRAGGFILLLTFLLLSCSLPACAQVVQVKYIVSGTGIDAQFWARGRLVGTLPRVDDQEKFETRVNNWARRLDVILSDPPPAWKIKARYVSGHAVITIGGPPLFTFDYREAKAMGTTTITMARKWAANLRYLVKNAPFVSLKKKVIVVPLGETVEIPYKGRFQGDLLAFDFDPSVVSVEVDSSAKKLRLEGLALGKGTFRLSAREVEFTGYYQVKMRAGHVPRDLVLEVSGHPATSKLVEEAFLSNLYYKCGPKPGAKLVMGSPKNKGKFKQLNPGQSLQLTIPTRLDGENYIASGCSLRLFVRNRGYSRPKPSLLLVSNRPEVITGQGDLFRRTIKGRTAARYFYHHRNDKGQPARWFRLELKNPGRHPVNVFVSPVGTGPTPDEIFAGHLAASAYFDYLKGGLGWFVTIKPGTSYVLDQRLLKPDQTISGVGYLSILDGSGLEVAVTASLPGELPPPGQVPMPALEEGRDHPRTSRGIFPAFIQLLPVHTIGSRYTYVYLGGEPYQADIQDKSPNYGNYGAFYNLDLEIRNPLDQEKEARVYIVPGGGAARGIIQVDGVLLETPVMWPAQRTLIKKVTVPSGESRKVNLLTMPQGGSFYPVKIVVESQFVKVTPDRQP